MPLQTRLQPVSSVNAEARTVDVQWTAGATVLRYDYWRDRPYIEELSTGDGAVRMDRLTSGNAPVLNDHDRWGGLESVLGVVSSASLDSANGTGQASLRFSQRDAVQPYFQDVQDGILRNVSFGYRIYAIDMIPPGQEDNDQWIYRAIDWEPYEISLVSIPADPNATVRGQRALDDGASQRFFPCVFNDRSAGGSSDGARASQLDQGAVMPGENDQPQTSVTPAAPAAAPATPAAPTARSDDAASQNDAARNAGIEAERQRVTDLRAAVRASVLDNQQELIDGFISRGVTVDAARAEILRLQAERSAANPQRGPANVVTVSDETVQRRAAMTDALMHRVNPRHKLTDAARQYRGLTLRELCRVGLEAAGIDTRGMGVMDLAGTALGVRGGYGTTSDLPVVFGNVINRTLRDAYGAAPRTFQSWARQGALSDFRAATRVMVDGALKLEKINEAGEYKYGTLTDGGETIQLATYGKVVAFTRQMIINDDLSALERVPLFFGRAAANLESDMVYAALTGNAPMSDGKALFHAAHGNLGTAAAIGIDSLSVARTAMRTQSAPGDGTALNLAPKFLLVPAALETVAYQYTSNAYTPTQATQQNPFQSVLTPIVESRLDAISAKSWYVVADPGAIDTIEYCYLDGEEGLYTEQSIDFDVDGVKVKARLDFAAKAIDFRGLFKNPGQ